MKTQYTTQDKLPLRRKHDPVAVVAAIIGFGVIAAIALTCFPGCSAQPTAESTFKEMTAAACKGDASSFFSHVDKFAVVNTMMPKMLATGREVAAEQSGGAGVMFQNEKFFKLVVAGATLQAANDVFKEWEDDVKAGEAGDWCHEKFISADNTVGTVMWQTPSGKLKQSVFAKAGDRWVMVEFNNLDSE